MSEQQMRKINALRAPLRDHITQFTNTKLPNCNQFDKLTCKNYKASLTNYLSKLEKLDDEYLNHMPNRNDAEAIFYDAEVQTCLHFSDKAVKIISSLDSRIDDITEEDQMTLINANNGSNNSSISGNRNNTNNNDNFKSKLQPLDLPTYSGAETENFSSFMDIVEEMLDGRGLGNTEKFLHLKKCLSGDPYHAISAIETNNDAWDAARSTLLELFLDDDEKKFNLLNKFNNLRFQYSESILSYYSRVDNLLREIDAVGINTEYFLQYFLWKSINSNRILADVYTKITEEAYPSFKDLREKRKKVMKLYNKNQKEFHERKSRLTNSQFKSKHDNKSKTKSKSHNATESGLAANIPKSKYSKDEPRKLWCTLCRDTGYNNEHPMYKCPRFITSGQKLSRLNFLKCCTKCCSSKHTSKDCSFLFKQKCRYCQGNHFSWLCSENESAKNINEGECESTKSESESESYSDSEDESDDEVGAVGLIENVHISMCSTSANKSCLPSNAILPTFQGKINGKSFRGLKDGGCQQNFLSVRVVKEAGLKVGQKVELTVSGFNSAKTYKTYEVQVPFEFGGNVYELDMIVLPEVSTRFSADGISSVAAGFESKGYLLADPALKYDRNSVNNLDMVLGISATHVFMEKVRTYGENNEHYFLETVGGVMPIGHSLSAYSSLKYLPHADKNINVSNSVKISTYNTHNDDLDYLEIKNNKLLKPSEDQNMSKTEKLKKVRSRSRSKAIRNESKARKIKIGKSKTDLKQLDSQKKIRNRSRSKSCIRDKSHNQKPRTKVKFADEIKKEKSKKRKNGDKSKSNVVVASPATIEVRMCSLTDKNEETTTTKIETKIDNNRDLEDSYKLSKVGSNYLRSLTPGYSKQEVFGSFGCFGAASQIDLDSLIAETLGYDQYEKIQPFSDVDSKIVDYVYNKT